MSPAREGVEGIRRPWGSRPPAAPRTGEQVGARYTQYTCLPDVMPSRQVKILIPRPEKSRRPAQASLLVLKRLPRLGQLLAVVRRGLGVFEVEGEDRGRQHVGDDGVGGPLVVGGDD